MLSRKLRRYIELTDTLELKSAILFSDQIKKIILHNELVLIISYKQRTMKETKEIGVRGPNLRELAADGAAIHLKRTQN